MSIPRRSGNVPPSSVRSFVIGADDSASQVATRLLHNKNKGQSSVV